MDVEALTMSMLSNNVVDEWTNSDISTTVAYINTRRYNYHLDRKTLVLRAGFSSFQF